MLVVRRFRWQHRDAVAQLLPLAQTRMRESLESAHPINGGGGGDSVTAAACSASADVQAEILRIVASYARTGNIPRAVSESRMFRPQVWKKHMVPVRHTLHTSFCVVCKGCGLVSDGV